MISAMPFEAVVNTLSACPKASRMDRLPYISLILSLRITKTVSQCSFKASIPSLACLVFFLPSKAKGEVTMPTVKIPISCATDAITGAAPVPVPPPIPAVMKIILVSSPRSSLISSLLSIAAFRPFSGLAPAPNPLVKLIPI